MLKHIAAIPQAIANKSIWERKLRVAAYCRVSTDSEECLQNSPSVFPGVRFLSLDTILAQKYNGIRTK